MWMELQNIYCTDLQCLVFYFIFYFEMNVNNMDGTLEQMINQCSYSASSFILYFILKWKTIPWMELWNRWLISAPTMPYILFYFILKLKTIMWMELQNIYCTELQCLIFYFIFYFEMNGNKVDGTDVVISFTIILYFILLENRYCTKRSNRWLINAPIIPHILFWN